MSNNTKINGQKNSTEQQKTKLITDPSVVKVLFHEKRQEILELLIEKELTIIDINKETKINPGTIKRHLTELLEFDLVAQTREEINNYSVRMKYYRATAKEFIINLRWPKI